MTGKERILKTIQLQKTDRIPWLPFVGCHAASLINMTPEEYLTSEDAIVRGVKRAAELYNPDGLPVAFDLQVEAEAMGCEIRWSDKNPPAVVGHILETQNLLNFKIPTLGSGRIPVFMKAAARLRKELPDTALFGLITGPFTLAMHLMGVNIFIQMFDSPDLIKDYIQRVSEICKKMAQGYIDAGCDVIAVVDPMTSQISPEHFQAFVTPALSHTFEYIRTSGALSSLFVCGDAQQNISVMADSGPDNICIDENIPLDFVKSVCLKKGISFGGNMRLTTVLLLGTPLDNSKHALDCMDTGGETGYILAPGCDIPFDTPPDNIRAISKVVTDPYEAQIARELSEIQNPDMIPKIDLSEYGRAEKIIVDIITLDSEGCAPCQYMVESVMDAVQEFEGIVEWREHKIKHTDGLAFMTSLMVRNIPTICIDGKIKFVSKMPKRDELIRAIQQRINEKLRHRIQIKRAELMVLGDETDANSLQTFENVKQAIKELGSDVQAAFVKDPEIFKEFGVKVKPTVIFARYNIKSSGKVPEIKIIKEWIKMLDD